MHVARAQSGFSLVELMVALLLGVVLTGGVISVFITSKTSYSLNNAVGQVQEEGRLALSTMQPLVAQAGFMGCSNNLRGQGITPNNTADDGDEVKDFLLPVYGFEYQNTGSGDQVTDSNNGVPVLDNNASDWSPALTTEMLAAFTPAANSDILMLHEGLGNPANLVTPYASTGGTTLYAYASTTTSPLSAGDIAVVSNCSAIVMFPITGSTVTPGNSGTVQGSGWTPTSFQNVGGQLGQMQTYIFFVGKGVDGGYSLYEATLTADTGTTANNGKLSSTVIPSSVREIVPGVENMQILYGVNNDGDTNDIPDSYETASQVDAGSANCGGSNCWSRVVSVRIALIVRSDDDSIPKEQAPTAATGTQMLGVAYGDSVNYYPAVDRRIHRYFVETISLRNALP